MYMTYGYIGVVCLYMLYGNIKLLCKVLSYLVHTMDRFSVCIPCLQSSSIEYLSVHAPSASATDDQLSCGSRDAVGFFTMPMPVSIFFSTVLDNTC